jgi:hypothetical protein
MPSRPLSVIRASGAARDRAAPAALDACPSGQAMAGAVAAIPAAPPWAADAQRLIRAKVAIAIAGAAAIGLGESLWIANAACTRPIVYAPASDGIRALAGRGAAVDWVARTLAELLVVKLESYTPASIGRIWVDVAPFLHPALLATMRHAYEDLSATASRLWQHRVGIPLGVVSCGSHDGLIDVAVFFESVELTGRDVATRTIGSVVRKGAFLEFAEAPPSGENATGLILVHCAVYDRRAWLERGDPDLWNRFLDDGDPARRLDRIEVGGGTRAGAGSP